MASRTRSAIAGMTIEQLHCRDFGHAWRAYTARPLPKKRFESILVCGRCESKRVRVLSDRGDVLANHYRYEPGYLVKGAGRLTADDRGAIRLASVMAAMPERAKLRAVPS